MGSVLLLKCSLCRVLQLLDVVDRGELADGGLGSVVGVVIDHDLAALDLLLDCLVLIDGKGLEVPAVLIGGQTDVIAVLQAEVAVGSSLSFFSFVPSKLI